MNKALNHSWGDTALIILGLFSALLVGITCLPFSLAAHLFRSARIFWRQSRATRNIQDEQKDLLRELWQAEFECRQYAEAYERGYYETQIGADAAMRRVDALIVRCQAEGVQGWRIDAFRITSYD